MARLEFPSRSILRPLSSSSEITSHTSTTPLSHRLSPSPSGAPPLSLASPRLSSRLSTRPSDSFGYSSDFVNQLEKKHDAAIASLSEKLRVQEHNHAQSTESLHKSAAAHQLQAELSVQSHIKEARVQNQELEARLAGMMRDKNETERNLRNRVLELSNALEAERARSGQYLQDLSRLKGSSEDEIAKLRGQLRLALDEATRVQSYHNETSKRDYETMEQERQYIQAEKQEYIYQVRRQYDAQVTELRLRLESKDALLISIEQDLADARRQLSTRAEASARDLHTMQETLRSTRKVLELQELDLDRLKRDKEETRKEGQIISKEAAILEHDLGQLRHESKGLKAQNKRMQKIVYGRSPRKRTNKAQ